MLLSALFALVALFALATPGHEPAQHKLHTDRLYRVSTTNTDDDNLVTVAKTVTVGTIDAGEKVSAIVTLQRQPHGEHPSSHHIRTWLTTVPLRPTRSV